MLVKSKLICLITILLLNLIAASSATASNSVTTLPALPAISLPSDTNNPDLSNSMNNSWWNKIKSFFGFNVESEQNKLEANNVQNIENSFNNDLQSNNEKLESNQLNTKSHNFITLDNNSLPRLHDDDNTDIELAELPDILKATQMQDNNNMQTKLNINQTQELYSQINRDDSQKQDYTSSSQGYQTQIIKSHKPKINNTNLTALLKLPVPTQSLREQHHNMQSTTQDFSNKYEVINNLNQLENTQSELEQQTQTTNQDSKVSLSLNFEEYKEKNIDTSNSLSLISNQQETINSETTLKQQPDLPLTTTLNENNADNNNSSNTEPNSDVTDIDLTHNPDKNSIPLVDNYANQALSNDTSSTNNDTDDTDDDTDDDTTSTSILDSNTNSDAIQLLTNDNSSTANTDNISTILKTDDADINNINLDIQNNNQDIETSMISELENHETNINTSDVNEFTINTNHDTNNNSQNESSEKQAEPSSTSIQTTDSNQSNTDNSTQHNDYDTTSNANAESEIDTTKTKIDIKPRDSVELSMFLDRELIILTAENDDIELGQLTDKAKLKLIDDWKYIKLIEKEINYRKEASKRQAVNNIIQYHRMKTKKMQDLTQKDTYISKCYK
ncbi:hypothetical protein [Orientia tsutsugamushi]|uniref:Uncharacterized protein n=1 Tax=Orientia tsutsugamushi TaxID=784 RepID=A0A2U3RSQ5_ORITS|nr:hypothetical protein [Orientia tsutsugamushi]KJV57131.1 hypothetical protein OTSKARP_0325 [Orientia tsutsugamushi str. Karp]SPR16249.1 Uncharacterised protein [Orientia tsutsugamushi]